MSFNPDGEVASQLKTPLMNELRARYNIDDDAEDVAEFIMVSIGNNVAPQQIIHEVAGLVDCQMDVGFINSIMSEIEKLENQVNGGSGNGAAGSSAVANNSVFPPPSAFVPPAPSQENQQASTNTFEPSYTNGGNQEKPVNFHPILSFPTGPKGAKKGGISKSSTSGGHKKLGGKYAAANLEKALAHGNVKTNSNKPKGRCPDFPYCTNKECELAHPTKECYAYPNCLNGPGTCNFLHPGEDGELMAKLEQSKREYQEKKAAERAALQSSQQQQQQLQIIPCKYGKRCSKEGCTFGHPTPANEVPQQITQSEWCVWGRQCADANCGKAHPSPNYKPEIQNQTAPSVVPQPTLEQCKFGAACTNFKCLKRHASTPVKCREGSNCVRIDCFFSHPIDEDCRFGINCTNKVCMFRHPEGRQVMETNTWRKEEKVYAVPDDEVMEQAVQN